MVSVNLLQRAIVGRNNGHLQVLTALSDMGLSLAISMRICVFDPFIVPQLKFSCHGKKVAFF